MCILWGSLAKWYFLSIHYPCENLWRINLSFIYLHEQNLKLMPMSRPEIAVPQTSQVAAWDEPLRVLPSSYPVLISKSNLCDWWFSGKGNDLQYAFCKPIHSGFDTFQKRHLPTKYIPKSFRWNPIPATVYHANHIACILLQQGGVVSDLTLYSL